MLDERLERLGITHPTLLQLLTRILHGSRVDHGRGEVFVVGC
jgi:hypothetical protein